MKLNPGDALFGITAMPEGQSQTLISAAYEETHLLAVGLKDWMQQVNAVNGREPGKLVLQMQQWSDRLVEVFDNSGIVLNGLDVSTDTNEQLSDCLHQFHADFLRCLHQLNQQETEARTAQFRNRQQLNKQVTQRALGDLTSFFGAKKAEFLQEDSKLLSAAGAVGRALGIEIRPPARSEDLNRVKDSLEAIARASRIRTRRVILSGVWWKSDCGALLAYIADGEHAVVILPMGNNRYEIFDPKQRCRIPVNAHTAQQLSPVAYMFYRPLP